MKPNLFWANVILRPFLGIVGHCGMAIKFRAKIVEGKKAFGLTHVLKTA
jgi:hypothetical protein